MSAAPKSPVVVTVVYPATPGAKFDPEYYVQIHLPMVQRLWGPVGLEAADGVIGASAPDGGPPPFLAISLLRFGSLNQIQAALSGVHAPAVMGDVANFTDAAPIVQLSTPI